MVTPVIIQEKIRQCRAGRGSIRHQLRRPVAVVVALRVAPDAIHHRAGSIVSAPVAIATQTPLANTPRENMTPPAPIFRHSSDGHADASRELPELQVNNSVLLAAIRSRTVTLVGAVAKTSMSPMQPRIELLMHYAVVLLPNAVECLRQLGFWCVIPPWYSLGCTLSMTLYNEARTRERSDRGHFLPSGKKASS